MSDQLVSRQRIASIDVLRGIVMVIMALDHTRDFFHIAGATDQPTNMATTTLPLFFTRWITHFCAPVFLFLSGIAAFLNGRKKTRSALSGFLLKRGLWLVLVEITVVSLVLTLNPYYNLIFLIVFWAIGVSMILLSVLIWLPYRVLLALGLVLFFGHNLLDFPEAALKGSLPLFWAIVHGRAAVIPLNATHTILIGYSFLPWTGLMILGYCCGRLFTNNRDPILRKRVLLYTGGGLFLLFILLRIINVYGDPVPWSEQKSQVITFLSFMNANKYPPSLIFCCMTIGPALVMLALIENTNSRLTRFFSVYGAVPMFYFVLHLLLIRIICVALFFAEGYPVTMAFSTTAPLGFRPAAFGYQLWIVYLIWLMVVLAMYPLCKKYGRFKETKQYWWLSYL